VERLYDAIYKQENIEEKKKRLNVGIDMRLMSISFLKESNKCRK